MALFKGKSKLPEDNAWSYFEAKKALVRQVANKFAAGIENSGNDLLNINGTREILDYDYRKRRLQWENDNSKAWPDFLVGNLFIFGNNIIKIFL